MLIAPSTGSSRFVELEAGRVSCKVVHCQRGPQTAGNVGPDGRAASLMAAGLFRSAQLGKLPQDCAIRIEGRKEVAPRDNESN